VPREELQQALWPADTHVDFERGVNAAVNRLRDVLGDSADNPTFIETLPRRGYRFIAPIEGLAAQEAGVAPATSRKVQSRVRPALRNQPRQKAIRRATVYLPLARY
jgi:cholera toxin transcriptional activator